MKAVVLDGFGGPEVLRIGESEAPVPKDGQVLIEVAATSVNRPDILQREGRYPPPPGESPLLGLEAAGVVAELGPGVEGLAVGDRVVALLGGGGYAELAVAYAGHVMKIPPELSFEAAACIPETYITAYMNLFINARLTDGETVLLHGGGGGVTTAAMQLCKTLTPRARVIVTASTGKVERVADLGADFVIDYKTRDFADAVLEYTDKRGVDVILDHIGAPYLGPNLKSLAIGGRLAVIAVMGGRRAELDLGRVLVQRLTIVGSVLRPRPVAEKTALIQEFSRVAMPHFASGALAPVIHHVYPVEQVAEAHRAMEASQSFGKLVLTLGAHL